VSGRNLPDTPWRYVIVVAALRQSGDTHLFPRCCPPYIPLLRAGHGMEVCVPRFASPVMRLVEETRTGCEVTKRYDKARTLYRRMLQSRITAKRTRGALKQESATLNPVKLYREINRLQVRLEACAHSKHEVQQNERSANMEYIST